MNKVKSLGLLLCVLVVILVVWNTPKSAGEIHLSGATMGTSYNVKVLADVGLPPEELQQKIDDLLVDINKLMSTYDPNSELSRFNQQLSSEPFKMSPATLTVLKEAKRLGEVSLGVLDVTIGPLVNLWGFGPEARPEKIPSQQTIDSLKEQIGLNKLVIQDNYLIKLQPDLYVDLSTIAKGYGVDAVAELLESYGYKNYLVEIGGEMRVAGVKSNGSGWRIAVEKPVNNERAVQSILTIGNNAVATSGDYRNYFEQDGIRYSHLIDPRTGYPIQHNLVAVTVVHPSSMTADGLATALNVLGKDDALRVAKEHNLDVMLITREKGSFKAYTTGKFDEYINAATEQ
ncbi:FAD:protein FMN transferase [Aliiglaciecola sp. 2_MG-2023]|uniref:FAD:protein FMN transferase n=1 Tax=Alteromonadaceae TaxID=72275 RepID=UPI0026E433E6|nr:MULTISPECIES: FAD:protein FMN transferase [unclassified Aliiglaciecola]MDO6709501.1 FAD:protein FMN transferase [Aliiglaciecola sp. 2_MG-2023]MDO6750957.1 FAD:protein FMN transferase [Aliiglaciecola sp. 1_MG-2023]